MAKLYAISCVSSSWTGGALVSAGRGSGNPMPTPKKPQHPTRALNPVHVKPSAPEPVKLRLRKALADRSENQDTLTDYGITPPGTDPVYVGLARTMDERCSLSQHQPLHSVLLPKLTSLSAKC